MEAIRSIDQFIKELREEDPKTAVSPYFIRQKIKSGEIPHIKAGRRILLNRNTVLEYLHCSTPTPIQPIHTSGIRQISDK